MNGPGPSTAPSLPEAPREGAEPSESASLAIARRPRGTGGRTERFRARRAERRSLRRDQYLEVVVIAIVLLGIYTIVTARPNSASFNNGFPAPGPPIQVHFGTPTLGTANCGGGGTAAVEKIPWDNSTAPVTTGDVNIRLFEIFDGDYIGDPGAVANATPTNVCAGVPPTQSEIWYVVLAAANGTNLLTYTVAQGWTSLTGGAWNFDIASNSTVVLVTYASLSGTGRGLGVTGFSSGSPITGSVVL